MTPDDVFARRRARFFERIGDGVAVLFSVPEAAFGHDIHYRYRPDPDLYYLTGFAEPECAAVLDGRRRKWTLFVRRRNRERETWEGRRAGPRGAITDFGADAAHPVDELDERLPELIRGSGTLWHALGVDPDADARVGRVLARFRREARDPRRGPTAVLDPTEVLHEMRLRKEPGEVEALARSCALAARAHRDAMAAGRAGAFEYEVEAAVLRRFTLGGAPHPSYPTIVASGPNATILHYVENRRRIGKDDLVLVDAGCELDGYASDITRTFPASGRFTRPQRRLYAVVLAAQKAAVDRCRPGATVLDVQDAAHDVLVDGLLDLGLLRGTRARVRAKKAHERFTLHRVSHWLGLDVHDRGRYTRDGESRKLEPGMVLTVEPGLYVRPDEKNVAAEWLGIGIRIEDDVLVTGDGPRVLTAGAPKEVDELEGGAPGRVRR
ncbi:M24 family metallopeptidase [Acidobacteria bacterium ACD]|nr:MAG: M24 family metallopeptidase [Acidobacteriota bacterium]MDL1949328.1 M24 family metallopeptidase [Acidobacteria bacterium ACD]